MSLQLWYLRRAVPWPALLGCALLALGVALLIERWPSSSLLMLPVLLACCVTASTFAFDETALSVIEVTPRGGPWRRSARLAVGVVPAALWLTAVLARPGDLPLDRGEWGLVGAAAIAAGLATAGLLSDRRSVASPGALLAPWAVLALCGPVVASTFLGVEQIYPYDEMGAALTAFWVSTAAAGALVATLVLRAGPRR